MVGYGQITISSLVDASPSLGMKVDYESFTKANNGKAYLHGYTNEVAADVAGYVMWNGVKRTVPKAMVNPNAGAPYNKVIYIVLRLSSATAATGTLYNVWYNSGWKYGAISAPSAATWTWAEVTDIVLGQYVEPGAEVALVDAYLYWPPKRSTEVWMSESAYEKAASAQSTANTANTSATNANNKIDNLQIGGRNLYRDSNAPSLKKISAPGNRYFSGSSNSDASFTGEIVAISDPPVMGIRYGAREVFDNTVAANKRHPLATDTNNIKLKEGHTYIASFWCKLVSGSCEIVIQLGSSPYEMTFHQIKGSGWQHYEQIFTYTEAKHGENGVGVRLYMGARPYAQTACELLTCGYQIEEGNKATTWKPATEDTEAEIEAVRETAEKAKYQAEVVVGTQTQKTEKWTGNASFPVLVDGQTILFWLPFDSKSNVTLNLTLPDGSKTDEIPCYYGGISRLGAHYTAGNAVRLLYRENVTISTTTIAKGWWADANYNTNNYDRIQHTSAITAKTAITGGHMVVSGADGQYFHLAANMAFDITKPILYAASAITATKSGTNNYLVIPNINLTSTKSGFTGTSQSTVYIVGTLNGSLFTPNATLITTDQPQAEDGLYYISLGRMRSTTNFDLYPEHPIFKFYNGKFQTTEQMAYEAFVQAKNAQSDIDGLEIGGRNLLVNTAGNNVRQVHSSGSGNAMTLTGFDTYTMESGVIHLAAAAKTTEKYIRFLPPIDNQTHGLEPGGTYTFSFLAKGTAPDLRIRTQWKTTGGWTGGILKTAEGITDAKYTLISATDTLPEGAKAYYLSIQSYDNTAGTDVYIKKLMLEKGNRPTDWTPAPEDFDNHIAEETVKVYTNSVTSAQGFFNDAIKEYVRTTDIETFKQTVRTELNQTSDSIEMIFANAVEQINALSEGTASEFAEIKKYIRFVNGSIILGEEDNPLVLTLVNNRIAFTSNGGEVAYFSDNQMHVDNVTVVNGADLCGLRITKDSNGDVYIS